MSIKVIILEDDLGYQKTIAGYIESDADLQLRGLHSTTWGSIDKIIALEPDVVIADIEMPSSDEHIDRKAGTRVILELNDRLGDKCPSIVVLTHLTDDDRIFEAFCSGGSISYITKPSNRTEILNAVHQAHAKTPFCSPYIARRSTELLTNPLIRRNADLLSKRELEALTYLKQGYSQVESAEHMGIKSISDLLKSIYKKLQVHSQRAAENKVWYNHLDILSKLRK